VVISVNWFFWKSVHTDNFLFTHHASKDDNLQTLIRQGIPLFFIVKNFVQKIELKSK
jgi:hypothetical protein